MTERCKMDPYLVGSKSCFFWKKGKVEIVDDAEVQNRRNMMFTIREYVKVSSLEEAYELNQKKTNVIFGGGVWLRLGKKHIQTAIDLSALGLDGITEDADAFSIGCMTTLHTLEIHEGIHAYTKGAVRESLRHIVGVQMRICATVGGSIFGRFGFSDILCCLMGLDCDVELYRGGRVALTDFTRMKKDTDILVRVILKKSPVETVYLSQRNTATDFPVVSCAVSKDMQGYRAVVGARPCMPVEVRDTEGILCSKAITEKQIHAFGAWAAAQLAFADNTRASGAYRRHIAEVLIKRGLRQLTGGNDGCGFGCI